MKVDVTSSPYHSHVARMATRLTGDAAAAAAVTAEVFRRYTASPNRPADGDAAARWFAHHTVLASREFGWSGGDATVAAALLGRLPIQQREALILRHQEAFDARQTAVAMDCSVFAAERHLEAAEAAVRDAVRTAADGSADIPSAIFSLDRVLASEPTESRPRRRTFRLWIWLVILAAVAVLLVCLRR